MMAPNKDKIYEVIKGLGRSLWSSTEEETGLLVTLSQPDTSDVTRALKALGYTVIEVSERSLVISGIDRIALIDSQIAALTAERERLLAERRPLGFLEEAF